ncbi:uncharacterized protein LOC6565683 [Drosophila grimshawi]|uniref:uncharacterized protein LOC6565683 n=1 Tax=Drosophila grimshawi TaxID=7222 RepID=UPI0013EF3A42|nr:uncharacterized protein LOC6565683 [Drosophila grimshawi]
MSSEATPHIPAVATPIEFGSIMFIQLAKLAKDVSRDLRSVHQEARSEEERYGVAWRRVGEAASSSFRVNAAQDEPQDACVLTDFIVCGKRHCMRGMFFANRSKSDVRKAKGVTEC